MRDSVEGGAADVLVVGGGRSDLLSGWLASASAASAAKRTARATAARAGLRRWSRGGSGADLSHPAGRIPV